MPCQSMADGPLIEDPEERARLRAEARKARREAAAVKVGSRVLLVKACQGLSRLVKACQGFSRLVKACRD
jgi:hypothetical protein